MDSKDTENSRTGSKIMETTTMEQINILNKIIYSSKDKYYKQILNKEMLKNKQI